MRTSALIVMVPSVHGRARSDVKLESARRDRRLAGLARWVTAKARIYEKNKNRAEQGICTVGRSAAQPKLPPQRVRTVLKCKRWLVEFFLELTEQ